MKTDLECVRPYASLIHGVCTMTGEDPFRLAALGLRESRWGWAKGYAPKGNPCGWGDHGFGYGLFQIDKRYHPEFVNSAHAKDPKRQALYALGLLRANRVWL